MTREELHEAYEAKFGKKVSPRFSNDLAWIQEKLGGCEDCKIEPAKTEAGETKEELIIAQPKVEQLYVSTEKLEAIRREEVKRKCKALGKKIITNGKLFEVMNWNEKSESFGNGLRRQYKTLKDAENSIG